MELIVPIWGLKRLSSLSRFLASSTCPYSSVVQYRQCHPGTPGFLSPWKGYASFMHDNVEFPEIHIEFPQAIMLSQPHDWWRPGGLLGIMIPLSSILYTSPLSLQLAYICRSGWHTGNPSVTILCLTRETFPVSPDKTSFCSFRSSNSCCWSCALSDLFISISFIGISTTLHWVNRHCVDSPTCRLPGSDLPYSIAFIELQCLKGSIHCVHDALSSSADLA